MADIKPFFSIMPKSEYAKEIAALPYDVYSREEAKEAVKNNPLSFLRIDRAETNFDDSVSTYDDRVYEKAASLFNKMIEDGFFYEDEKACYYLYELTMEKRVQTGIVALSSIDDYDNNIIKKHENTRREKEEDRVRHVDTLSAQTGPIFLAYRKNDVINDVIKKEKRNAPLFDFTSDDDIRHRVFRISDDKSIDIIKNEFKNENNIYIADGHHRCASAVRVGKMRRDEKKDYTGEEEFNYFLSVLFPGDELYIMDYNRVVYDLNNRSEDDFLKELSEICTINPDEKRYPKNKGEFMLLLKEKGWFSCAVKDEFKSKDPVKGLDVSILQDNVLSRILDIDDPKTSKRIDFVGGIRGIDELVKRVNTDSAAAFLMYPTSIDELFSVADNNLLMPPKSTWFEPKLRSGLFIHKI